MCGISSVIKNSEYEVKYIFMKKTILKDFQD